MDAEGYVAIAMTLKGGIFMTVISTWSMTMSEHIWNLERAKQLGREMYFGGGLGKEFIDCSFGKRHQQRAVG